MKMSILALLLAYATSAFAESKIILRGELQNPYNNPTTLNMLFDPNTKGPLRDLHAWINCLADTIANPDYQIMIQNFALQDLGSKAVEIYNVVGRDGKSPAEVCRMIKSHLEANENNRAEVLLDEENGTATLQNLLRKGTYQDL